jgi:predicted nucleotidyltransferase
MVDFDENALGKLCRENGVRRLRIFGSSARGEERPDSDVDLIVEFGRPAGFVELVRLERLLAEIFGRPVDLTTEPGLDPYIRDSVLSSASVLYDAAA